MEYKLNINNPLFDGLCGGVDQAILYNTLHDCKKEIEQLQKQLDRAIKIAVYWMMRNDQYLSRTGAERIVHQSVNYSEKSKSSNENS